MSTWCPAGLRVDRHRREHHRRGARSTAIRRNPAAKPPKDGTTSSGCLVGGLHPRRLAGHQDSHRGGFQRHGPRHRHGPNSHLRAGHLESHRLARWIVRLVATHAAPRTLWNPIGSPDGSLGSSLPTRPRRTLWNPIGSSDGSLGSSLHARPRARSGIRSACPMDR